MNANMTGSGWTEAGNGIFSRRYNPCDVTSVAVVGSEGVLLVDTRCSMEEGRELREHVRALTSAPIRWVVNTHAHWDHVWGNAEFVAPRLEPSAEIWAHESVPGCFDPQDPMVVEFMEWQASRSPEWAAKIAELELYAPDHTVSTASARQTIDLGDRSVELRWFGRGHTEGDLALWVPDERVLVAGDLVEEAGASYGFDAYPLDWAGTLAAVDAFVGGDATVVPGHGPVRGADVLREQIDHVRAIADQITELHASGATVEEAVERGTWPVENPKTFTPAIARGYAQLNKELM